ncbi:MAG: sugar phosphate nucleotidyltransferase [Candidatus Peribacteraceae bacterium]|nr:sugar phosphate nucleotidyltransferase [Candidatus Peribacteraceae bacterium]
MSPTVTQAILPIAGLGTRFLPWTKAVPKEMLPIGTRPIIALIVDECLEAGIRDICFVISKGKEVIPRYFRRDDALEKELSKRGKGDLLDELRKYDEVRFHVVYQEEQLGDGHAILQAEAWVESEEVAILFGDDLFVGGESGLRQLLRGYEETAGEGERAVLAVENVPRDRTNRYGIIDVAGNYADSKRLWRVKGLVEKPAPGRAPSTLGIVGRYLIPRSTFRMLRTTHSGTNDGEIRLIDALKGQLTSLPVFGYECEGKRLDTGTPEGYVDAAKHIWP